MEFLVSYRTDKHRGLVRVQNGTMKRRLEAYKYQYNCAKPYRIHRPNWSLKESTKDFLMASPEWRVSYTPPRTHLTEYGRTFLPAYPVGKIIRNRIVPMTMAARCHM